MNRTTAGLPVHHQLLEFTQIHVHWVGDAIQPSHPLLSASLPALNLSQHQFNCSVMSDSATPWTAACQASLPFTFSQSWLKLMSIELMMPSNHLILCLHLLFLPSIFPSIRSFPMSQSALCIRWPNYWSFSFSLSASKEYSGLTFLRIWFFCSRDS